MNITNYCMLCHKRIWPWDRKTELKSSDGNSNDIHIDWFHLRCTQGPCIVCNRNFTRFDQPSGKAGEYEYSYNDKSGFVHRLCKNKAELIGIEPYE